MESRRSFFAYLAASLGAVLTAFLTASCSSQPDAETEPSPEWPPPEE